MRTVAETEIFQRYAEEVWTVGEREQFIDWIAANPESGAVITGSGGCRKGPRKERRRPRHLLPARERHDLATHRLQEGEVRQPVNLIHRTTTQGGTRCPLNLRNSKPIFFNL